MKIENGSVVCFGVVVTSSKSKALKVLEKEHKEQIKICDAELNITADLRNQKRVVDAFAEIMELECLIEQVKREMI